MFRLLGRAVRLTVRNPGRVWLLVRMATWVVILSALVRVLTLPRALEVVATDVRKKSTDDVRAKDL